MEYLTGVIVYGFNMGQTNCYLVHDYFKFLFPNIKQYELNTLSNIPYYTHAKVEIVYGIKCGFDGESGKAQISDRYKKSIHKLYNKYIKYLQKKLPENEYKDILDKIKLRFHTVVTGNDLHTCKYTFINLKEVEESDDDIEDNSEYSEDNDSDEVYELDDEIYTRNWGNTTTESDESEDESYYL